ncbi:MAG: SGNH/GDSL hydrolase family protein [Armatimonadetes bacterium]|nr:SGNH/GDSL hydrolase family protein [Armatimonadota bacterium]
MKCALLAFFLLPLLCGLAVARDEGYILARSLVTVGDTSRLQHVLAKARRNEEVVVAVIGGSITAGASASKEENRYGNLVAQWWRQTFPQATIRFVNAGIGATGSNLGAHRAPSQLLVHKPDLVIAEYAVNDPNNQDAADTLEGLTRQILKLPNQPAMMLLFTMNNAGANAQEWHSRIGEHYGLPMVSFRDALWPEIEAKRLKWEDVEADMVHPNDRGHAYCATFITKVLAKVLADLPPDVALSPILPIPAPLISDVFEFTSFANALVPVANTGWANGDMWPFGKTWEATEPGSTLEFQVEGTAVSVACWKIKGDMGMARLQVDDAGPVTVDGWFSADWGGHSCYETVARNLPPGKHTLRIEVLPDRAKESNGHKFILQLVMSAGLKGSH